MNIPSSVNKVAGSKCLTALAAQDHYNAQEAFKAGTNSMRSLREIQKIDSFRWAKVVKPCNGQVWFISESIQRTLERLLFAIPERVGKEDSTFDALTDKCVIWFVNTSTASSHGITILAALTADYINWSHRCSTQVYWNGSSVCPAQYALWIRLGFNIISSTWWSWLFPFLFHIMQLLGRQQLEI